MDTEKPKKRVGEFNYFNLYVKQLTIQQLEKYKGGASCTKTVLGGFFAGLVSGATAGAEFVVFGPQAGAAGVVLGGSYGAVSGALLGYAAC